MMVSRTSVKESLKKTFERIAICWFSIFKEAVLMNAVRLSNYSDIAKLKRSNSENPLIKI